MTTNKEICIKGKACKKITIPVRRIYLNSTKNVQYLLKNLDLSNSSCSRPNIEVNFSKCSNFGVGNNTY